MEWAFIAFNFNVLIFWKCVDENVLTWETRHANVDLVKCSRWNRSLEKKNRFERKKNRKKIQWSFNFICINQKYTANRLLYYSLRYYFALRIQGAFFVNINIFGTFHSSIQLCVFGLFNVSGFVFFFSFAVFVKLKSSSDLAICLIIIVTEYLIHRLPLNKINEMKLNKHLMIRSTIQYHWFDLIEYTWQTEKMKEMH